MSQAGYTPISLYYSTTAAAIPTSGNLANGELGLNIADMKLYAKNSAGTVTLLASSGGATGTVSSVAVSGGTTGLTTSGGPITTSGTITLAGTLATANGGTNLTSFTSGGAVYATSTSALTTGTLPIASGGTGQTTASAAFNALSPITTTGDLIVGNGANSATRLAIGGNGTVLQSNGTTASWGSIVAGASLSNDTTTATDLFPMFASATSGTPTTVFTSNAKLLYKPSTGEFQASELVASNGIFVNNTTVSVSYTVASGNNAMSVGPITVASGQSVTVTSGQRWVVL